MSTPSCFSLHAIEALGIYRENEALDASFRKNAKYKQVLKQTITDAESKMNTILTNFGEAMLNMEHDQFNKVQNEQNERQVKIQQLEKELASAQDELKKYKDSRKRVRQFIDEEIAVL